MESISSDGKDYRIKAFRRLAIIIISFIFLLAIVVAAIVLTVEHKRDSCNDSNSGSHSNQSSPAVSAAALKAICNETLHPDSCFASISSLGASTNVTTNPKEIFNLSLRVVHNSLQRLSSVPGTVKERSDNDGVKGALHVCRQVIDDALYSINDCISSMESGGKFEIGDLNTWLSAAMSNLDTCLDALKEETDSDEILADMKGLLANSSEFVSNSLAIVAKVMGLVSGFENPPVNNRKLLAYPNSGKFPDWVMAGDQRLLEEGSNAKTPNVTVAIDGSGDVKTINEAVAKVPKNSTKRFLIYVKAGTYVEYVNVDKQLWNVMMYGDGKDKTIVSGSKSSAEGLKTFDTATFAVGGQKFIAKDMKFVNTAGPEKEQAVALRSSSDFSVFYNCSFDGFQDTLYAHSNRQFYRECDITGTVDFIFGHSAVVFQKCNIQPRQPLDKQFVTITAQGRNESRQFSGIAIQNCRIMPLDNLTAPAYLGRPWKEFSTTVVMQSYIGGFLNPSGWSEWEANVEPPKTIYYAEYQNTGPGSGLDKRVNWTGYNANITAEEARKFTVENFLFLESHDWIAETNINYDISL